MAASAETAEPTGEAAVRTTVASQPILLLGSLSALAALSLDMYVPGLPALATDLHTSASAIPPESARGSTAGPELSALNAMLSPASERGIHAAPSTNGTGSPS